MITPPKTLFDASSLKSAIVFLEITVILHGEQLWGLEKRIRDWMGLPRQKYRWRGLPFLTQPETDVTGTLSNYLILSVDPRQGSTCNTEVMVTTNFKLKISSLLLLDYERYDLQGQKNLIALLRCSDTV